jgi:hypothetical protein
MDTSTRAVVVQVTAVDEEREAVGVVAFSRTVPPITWPATTAAPAATNETGRGDPRFDEYG